MDDESFDRATRDAQVEVKGRTAQTTHKKVMVNCE